MRNILAGTAFLALTSLTPAAASTFNYDVNINLNGTTIAGNIETSCNNCFLTGSNIVGYYFQSSIGNVVHSQAGEREMYWLAVIGIPALILGAVWLFVLFVQFLYWCAAKSREQEAKEQERVYRLFHPDKP